MKKILCIVLEGFNATGLANAHIGSFEKIGREGVCFPRICLEELHTPLPTLCSLLTSLSPDRHGVIRNADVPHAIPMDLFLPALLHYRQQAVSFFSSAEYTARLFPPRLLQTGFLINAGGIRNLDDQVFSTAAAHLQKQEPDFCLLYLNGSAIAGNHFGYHSDPYYEAIESACRGVCHVFNQLKMVGLDNEYVTFLLGYDGKAEHQASLLVKGPGIRCYTDTLIPSPALLDIVPTMAQILNIPPHPDWEGKVLHELLISGGGKPAFPEKNTLFDWPLKKSALPPDETCSLSSSTHI